MKMNFYKKYINVGKTVSVGQRKQKLTSSILLDYMSCVTGIVCFIIVIPEPGTMSCK